MTDKPKEHWHLDKRVPIILILTLAIQTGYFSYSYGVLNNKVTHLEKAQDRSDEMMARVVRMETLVEGVLDTLTEIKDRLNNNND